MKDPPDQGINPGTAAQQREMEREAAKAGHGEDDAEDHAEHFWSTIAPSHLHDEL